MSTFYEERVTVTTTGTAGSATGTGQSEPINGELVAVKVDYNASAPATTTVDLDEVGGAARKLLDKAASTTDAVHHPRVLPDDNAGTPLTGIYELFALAGRRIQVTVAASDALDPAVDITLIIRGD